MYMEMFTSLYLSSVYLLYQLIEVCASLWLVLDMLVAQLSALVLVPNHEWPAQLSHCVVYLSNLLVEVLPSNKMTTVKVQVKHYPVIS